MARLSQLHRSQIRAQFIHDLETRRDAYGLDQLVELNQSVAESETYRFIRSVPQLEEFRGHLNLRPLTADEITLRNLIFKLTVPINLDDIRRDRTGQINRRIGELADSAAEKPVEIMDDLLSQGDTTAIGAAFDGKAFFAADHSVGASGTINNAVTDSQVDSLEVAGDVPTVEEATKILMDLMAHMMSWKDTVGRPINVGMRNVLVHAPPPLWAPFATAAAASNLAGGQTNPLMASGLNVKVVLNAGVDWTTEIAMFNTDARSKAFLMQEETAPEVDFMDESNAKEWVESNEAIGVIGKWRGNLGYGDFRRALKATVSSAA